MRTLGTGIKAWILSSALLFGCPMVVNAASSHRHVSTAHIRPHTFKAAALHHSGRIIHPIHTARLAPKWVPTRFHGISCVPYARAVSGIKVAGNAWQWWGNAAGQYARGDQPEPGSVLNFRANGRMRLGHVAVVAQVVNAREVMVDQANWPNGGGGGGVSRNVAVVDVSEANNWSAVRVELGHGRAFGSVYPTYGFIYNRPDNGVVVASVARPSPQPDMNPVPSDLRPAAERPWHTREEVAEAPSTPRHTVVRRGIDLRVTLDNTIQ